MNRRAGWAAVAGAALLSAPIGMAGLGMPWSALGGEWVGFRADGLAYEAVVRAAVEQPGLPLAVHSDRFGWPGGMDLAYFPTGDAAQLTVLKALAQAVGVGPAMNLFVILGFPLAVLTAAWLGRRAGLGWVSAALLGFTFSLLPYHLVRATEHLFIGQLWPVPLALLAVLVPVAHAVRSGRERLPGRDTALMLVLAAVAGLAGLYYAAFAVLLWVPAAAVLLLRRRRGAWPIAPLLTLLTAVLTIAADLIASRQDPPLGEVFYRSAAQALAFGGTVADLLFGGGPLVPDGLQYEGFGMGPVASVCLVVVVGWAAYRWLRPRSVAEPVSATDELVVWLAASAFWMTLWYLRGGLGYLVAATVSPAFRSVGRALPFVAIIVLLAAFLLIRRWISRSAAISHPQAVGTGFVAIAAVAAVVAAVQSPVVPATDLLDRRAAVTSVVAAAQRTLGSCPMAQLPLRPYPEGLEPGEIPWQAAWETALTADPATPASRGAIAATWASGWMAPYYYRDPVTAAWAARGAGFCAVAVDMRGFADPAATAAALDAALGGAVAAGADYRIHSLAALDQPPGFARDIAEAPILVPGTDGIRAVSTQWGLVLPTEGERSVGVRVWNPAAESVAVRITSVVPEQRADRPADADTGWTVDRPAGASTLTVEVPPRGSAEVAVDVAADARSVVLRACAVGAWLASPEGPVRCAG